MAEAGLNKNQVIAELARSSHGELAEYVTLGRQAALEEPEFLAHLIAWNAVNGQVRDSTVALPIVAMAEPAYPEVYLENSLAHLGMLSPRLLLQAWRFARSLKLPGRMRSIRRLIERYLKFGESKGGDWNRWAVQHRRALQGLYATAHIKPGAWQDSVLFKDARIPGTVFADIANLGRMVPAEAAATIIRHKLPSVVIVPALGEKLKQPELLLALIERMTPVELVNNTKLLEKLGVRSVPAARAAFEAAIARVGKGARNTLKTARAVAEVDSPVLKAQLRAAQEKQIQNMSVEGNWLVLGDKSGSMEPAIEASRIIAGTLAKMVKGSVHLVFFDSIPRYMDVSGKDYDQILEKTKEIRAHGGTSIGCGLQHAMDAGIEVDGIAIVSDGGENTAPMFAPTYMRYVAKAGKAIPIYLYLLSGQEGNVFSPGLERAGIATTVFDLRGRTVDYYSLPAVVVTMRASRYSLVNEILETPLVALDEVFVLQEAAG